MFGVISQRFGVDKWAVDFFYQNRVVGWDSTPEVIGLEDNSLVFGLDISLVFGESEME